MKTKKRIGYVVQAGQESAQMTLSQYLLESLPTNKHDLKLDIDDTFKGSGARSVQVYAVCLVPIELRITRKSLKKSSS